MNGGVLLPIEQQLEAAAERRRAAARSPLEHAIGGELELDLVERLAKARGHVDDAKKMLRTGQLADHGTSGEVGMVSVLCGIAESLLVLATVSVAQAGGGRVEARS